MGLWEGPNMVVLDAEDIIQLLRSEIERAGGPMAFSKKARVDRATVHRTLKRPERPSRKIISALNLRVVYSPKRDRLKPNQESIVPRTKKGSGIAIVRPAAGPEADQNKLLLLVNGRSVRGP
jgi:hypothetical protein